MYKIFPLFFRTSPDNTMAVKHWPEQGLPVSMFLKNRRIHHTYTCLYVKIFELFIVIQYLNKSHIHICLNYLLLYCIWINPTYIYVWTIYCYTVSYGGIFLPSSCRLTTSDIFFLLCRHHKKMSSFYKTKKMLTY